MKLDELLNEEGKKLLWENLDEMVEDGFAHKEMKPTCLKAQFVSDSGMISVLT